MLSLAGQHQASGARCHFLEETNSELGLEGGARIRGAERKGRESVPGTAAGVHQSAKEDTAWEMMPRNSVQCWWRSK